MSLLDDVVDSLVGGAPVSDLVVTTDPSEQHEAVVVSSTAAPAPPASGVLLRMVVEATDSTGRSARATYQGSVPNGTITMMEMLSDGSDVLEQLAKSTVAAAAKSLSPQPGSRGGGQVLTEAASAPGPVGGRTKKAQDDPLASMLGLDLIEHQESLDHGQQSQQSPRPPPPPRQPPRMGGPHTTGPRPGAGHPRR